MRLHEKKNYNIPNVDVVKYGLLQQLNASFLTLDDHFLSDSQPEDNNNKTANN